MFVENKIGHYCGIYSIIILKIFMRSFIDIDLKKRTNRKLKKKNHNKIRNPLQFIKSYTYFNYYMTR